MFELEKQILKPYTFKIYIASVIITTVILFPIFLNEFIKIHFSFTSFSTFILLITEILYNIFCYIISSFGFAVVSYGIIFAVATLIISAKYYPVLFNRCMAVIVAVGAIFLFLFVAYKSYGILMVTDLDKEREYFDPENDYVYVTETGSKYHLSNCPSLKSIADEIYIWDAEEKGYEPCKVCNPSNE